MTWIEVFQAGPQEDSAGNKREWTESDLDKIADAYNSQTKHKAPLVLGHPKTDSPAHGWIEKLARVKDKLFAAVDQVSEAARKAVGKGEYRNVSIALYPDDLLRHVGLLGAVPPAVKGLAPVQFSEGEFAVWTAKNEKGGEMGDEKTEGKDREFADMAAQVKAQAAEIEKLKAALAAALKEKAAQKADADGKEFAAHVDGLVREGKVLFAEKEGLQTQFDLLYQAEQGREFAEAAKKPTEQLKAALSARPVLNPAPAGKHFAEASQAKKQEEDDVAWGKRIAARANRKEG